MKKIILVIIFSLILFSCEKDVQEIVSDELIEEEAKELINTGTSLEMERNTNLKWQSRDEIDFIKNVKEELIKIGTIKNENDILFNNKGIFLNGQKFETLESFKEKLFRLQEQYYLTYDKYVDGNLEIDFSKKGYKINDDGKILFGRFSDSGRNYGLGNSTCFLEKRSSLSTMDLLIGDDVVLNYIMLDNSIVGTSHHTSNMLGFGPEDNSIFFSLNRNNYLYSSYCHLNSDTFDINLIKINGKQLVSKDIEQVISDTIFGDGRYIKHYFTFILNGAKSNSKRLLEIAYNLKYKSTQTLEQFIETYKDVKELEVVKIENIGENKYKTLVNIDGTKYESIFEIVEEYKIKTISVTIVK